MPALLLVAKLCMLRPECKARSVSFTMSLAAATHAHNVYGKRLEKDEKERKTSFASLIFSYGRAVFKAAARKLLCTC